MRFRTHQGPFLNKRGGWGGGDRVAWGRKQTDPDPNHQSGQAARIRWSDNPNPADVRKKQPGGRNTSGRGGAGGGGKMHSLRQTVCKKAGLLADLSITAESARAASENHTQPSGCVSRGHTGRDPISNFNPG